MKNIQRVDFIGLTALIAFVIVLALPVLSYPLGRDQSSYAIVGRTILSGGMPYVDAWEMKPPPIYYLYALTIRLFGSEFGVLHALNFLLVPFGMVGLFWLGKVLGGRGVAYLSALFYGVYYFHETFASITQSDSLVGVPMIGAVVCAVIALRALPSSRRALWASVAAGAFSGIVFWFKQYLVFFILVLAVHHAWARWRGDSFGTDSSPRERATFAHIRLEALAFLLGSALTAGGLLGIFYSLGFIEEMLTMAGGASAYNAQYNDLGFLIPQIGHYTLYRLWHWNALIGLVGAWLPLTRQAPLAQGWRLVWGWFWAGFAFMLIQRLGFDTHWLPMLPPMALLGALSAVRLWHFFPRLSPTHAFAGVSVALAFMLGAHTWAKALPFYTGSITQEAYFSHFQAGDVRAEQSLAVVNYLKPHLASGDTLYIYGYRPEVTYMGGWRSPTRFHANHGLTAPWFPQAWRDENVALLWASMPRYVLVLESDYLPWVNTYNEDSHTLLQRDIELNNWLMANYERDTKLGDFLIWKRNTP